MKALVTGLLVAGAILGAAGVARADAGYEAGAFGGVHLFAPRNRLGRFDRDPVTTGYVDGGTFGGRFAYLPVRHVGAELQLSVIPTSTVDERTSATILYARGHLIGNIPLGRVRPFVLAGVGSATVVPTDPGYIRRDTDFNMHAGVGVKVDVDKLWGLRVDAQSNAVPRTDRTGFGFEGTLLVGVYGNFPWPPNPPLPFDKDKDQITDDKDECPDEPGELKFGGCPDPDAEEDKTTLGEDAEEAEGDKPAEPAKPEPTKPAPATPAPAPAPKEGAP